MLHIGITGGIGAGKSIVCRLFQALGVPVYDADSRARWLMEHDPRLQAQLRAAFGPQVYDATGRLDRILLARTVFAVPTQLAQLNALVHPQVGEDFAGWAAAPPQAGHPYLLKEAALLFESGSYRQLDRIITVYAPPAVRQARVLRRDPHRRPEDVTAIMGKQLSEEEKCRRADYVVTNDDQQALLPQVLALHELFSRALGN